MAVIAFASNKFSPGASTAALACALTWPHPVVLAECDPAGGDALAGYLSSLDIAGPHGLLPLVQADLHQQLEDEFWGQLVDLDAPGGRRLLLPGLSDLAQARAAEPTWPSLAALFDGLAGHDPAFDVLVDVGRLSPHSPWPLLQVADVVLFVLRADSLRAIAPASAALELLHRQLGPGTPVQLLLVGDGPYPPRDLQRRLRTPVAARWPHDPRTAAGLCGTGRLRNRGPLMRAAAGLHRILTDHPASTPAPHQAAASPPGRRP
jgi:hypothetical protein